MINKTMLASATALMLTMGAAQAQEKTLTISVYALAQDEFKAIVYDPFEAKCGCKLVVETGNTVPTRLGSDAAGGGGNGSRVAVPVIVDLC